MGKPTRLDVMSFIAVPAVAFSITFALLQQHRAAHDTQPVAMIERTVAASDAAVHAPRRGRSPPETGMPERPAAVPETPAAISARPPAPETPIAEQPAANTADELPMRISFTEAPGSARHQAVVVNESALALDAMLTVQNEATGKFVQVPFSLGPHAIKKFGLHDDPKLESGDRVMLQSAPYRDAGETVPQARVNE
jgi:hypothetical protein